jgi:thioredoxin reductase/ferredoxin
MAAVTQILLDNIVLITTALLVLLFVAPYIWMHGRHSKKIRAKQKEAVDYGLDEPVSIHPKVNRDKCIGSGACIKACPEKDILGTIDGKAETLYASRCVGHGACARACPVGAIELVFGTERRGVDIPQVFPNFETNIERLFIAGELGGMGLIRNSMKQGREAVEYIVEDLQKSEKPKGDDIYDLVIVGAGPAGLAASLQAKKENLNYLTIDQAEDFGGAILTYPRAKIVMTNIMEIPVYGKVRKKEFSKEELLELWNDIISKTGIKVEANEKVEGAEKINGWYKIKTSKRELKSRFILLVIGRRGTPRKLGVPGEKSPKVMYRLLEPEKFKNQNILVVGGGDSAVEAAVALGAQVGTKTTLSYRKELFARIKQGNRDRIEEAARKDDVELLMESNVKEIKPESVIIDIKGEQKEIENDSVFIFAGGELPNEFLKKLGIEIETKFGTR